MGKATENSVNFSKAELFKNVLSYSVTQSMQGKLITKF